MKSQDHYFGHNSYPTAPTLNQLNPPHTFTTVLPQMTSHFQVSACNHQLLIRAAQRVGVAVTNYTCIRKVSVRISARIPAILRVFVVYLNPSWKAGIVSRLDHNRFLSNSFYFINRPTIRLCIAYIRGEQPHGTGGPHSTSTFSARAHK
jgi:hypothetical protein